MTSPWPRRFAAGLALFDLVLGGGAVFAPGLYLELMHPRFSGGPTYLLTRTGVIWLCFAAVEIAAWLRPRAELFFLVGALRLIDVPADLIYVALAGDQGWFGVASLIASPMVNLTVGLYLILVGGRGLRYA